MCFSTFRPARHPLRRVAISRPFTTQSPSQHPSPLTCAELTLGSACLPSCASFTCCPQPLPPCFSFLLVRAHPPQLVRAHPMTTLKARVGERMSGREALYVPLATLLTRAHSSAAARVTCHAAQSPVRILGEYRRSSRISCMCACDICMRACTHACPSGRQRQRAS